MTALSRRQWLGLGALSLALPRGARAQAAPQGPFDGQGNWVPTRTWVFAVGVLRWQDRANFESFDARGRKDAALLRALAERGVPAAQSVFLTDADATLANVRQRLAAHLARVPRGDLFLFYYAGHGALGEDGMYLVPTDTRGDALERTGLAARELLDTLDRSLSGPALLTADCCYSGMLTAAATQRSGAARYAALTSSLASEQSTGNWTFTECLLDGLAGAAGTDDNGDGTVSLRDLAAYTERRMAAEEEQLSSFGQSAGFPADVRLAQARGARDPRVGVVVDVRWQQRWFKSVVRAVRGDGQQRVHYVGYDETDDEWVTPDRVRPHNAPQFAVGTPLSVRWRDRWYDGVVRGSRLGLHLVHYDGWEDRWDEWVASERLRPRGG